MYADGLAFCLKPHAYVVRLVKKNLAAFFEQLYNFNWGLDFCLVG